MAKINASINFKSCQFKLDWPDHYVVQLYDKCREYAKSHISDSLDQAEEAASAAFMVAWADLRNTSFGYCRRRKAFVKRLAYCAVIDIVHRREREARRTGGELLPVAETDVPVKTDTAIVPLARPKPSWLAEYRRVRRCLAGLNLVVVGSLEHGATLLQLRYRKRLPVIVFWATVNYLSQRFRVSCGLYHDYLRACAKESATVKSLSLR